MKSVKIGEFKNKLSAYLKYVRKGGELIVKDRDTPVAKVIPFEEPRKETSITEALNPLSLLKTSSHPSHPGIDSLATLKKEREE